MKKDQFKEFAYITFAMFLISVSVYYFLVPSGIVVGSISGLAMVLSQLLNASISTITFVLNIVLLVIGFLFIGKEFGAKTVYTSFLLPVFLWFFEKFTFPSFYLLMHLQQFLQYQFYISQRFSSRMAFYLTGKQSPAKL